MCITCMSTWLASLVPSFFVSYLAFFVFFVQETYTLHNKTPYEYLVQQFHIHKADQELTQSRLFNISYHYITKAKSCREIFNWMTFFTMFFVWNLILSNRRDVSLLKGYIFFIWGHHHLIRPKFGVLLFCNHIKLNFSNYIHLVL